MSVIRNDLIIEGRPKSSATQILKHFKNLKNLMYLKTYSPFEIPVTVLEMPSALNKAD